MKTLMLFGLFGILSLGLQLPLFWLFFPTETDFWEVLLGSQLMVYLFCTVIGGVFYETF